MQMESVWIAEDSQKSTVLNQGSIKRAHRWSSCEMKQMQIEVIDAKIRWN